MGKAKQIRRSVGKSAEHRRNSKAGDLRIVHDNASITGRHRADIPGRTVGLIADNPAEVVRKIEAGLPFLAIEKLQKLTGFALERLAEMARISNRTLARRKEQGKFSFEESERVLRLATVIERAIDLFDGDLAAAKRWLETPRHSFGGRPALEFAETEVGASEVRDLIGRIEHGVIS